jgi:hypothetical protein
MIWDMLEQPDGRAAIARLSAAINAILEERVAPAPQRGAREAGGTAQGTASRTASGRPHSARSAGRGERHPAARTPPGRILRGGRQGPPPGDRDRTHGPQRGIGKGGVFRLCLRFISNRNDQKITWTWPLDRAP